MNAHSRLIWFASLVTLSLAGAARAQVAKQATQADPSPIKALQLSPAAAPSPLFGYRLLPTAGELRPGDAAPIYLRLRHGDPEGWQQIGKRTAAWNDLPLDEIPIKEAREFVNAWSPQWKQMKFAARRESCNWNYTIDEQRHEIINVLLPDMPDLRMWARMVLLKARLEVAEKTPEKALKTIGEGMVFGRHIAQGPFYINGLVGISIDSSMVTLLEELVGRPGTPNLYWALTALPRPLISVRDAMEREMRLAENMIPQLDEVDAPYSPAEWTVLAEQMFAGLLRLVKAADPSSNAVPAEIRDQLPDDYASYKKKYLNTLRKSLRRAAGATEAAIVGMSDDEVMLRGVAHEYRVLRDGIFKVASLPYPDGLKRRSESDAAFREGKTGPVAGFAIMQAAGMGAYDAEVRLERRVAMLRTIEAIRLHMAAHGGQLPGSLDEIKEVAVPLDPATNTPFPYKLEGDTAVLTTPKADMPPLWPVFRLTARP